MEFPLEVLEAAHLYSYASVGEHYEYGGLLLRRDLHRLFVANGLHPYALYQQLHGSKLKVGVNANQREWLADHWAQHRM